MIKNGKLGLINQSNYPWTVILSDGSVRIVGSGAGMPLKPGMRIKFGNQGENGEIV